MLKTRSEQLVHCCLSLVSWFSHSYGVFQRHSTAEMGTMFPENGGRVCCLGFICIGSLLGFSAGLDEMA